jgi:hypothetical protein
VGDIATIIGGGALSFFAGVILWLLTANRALPARYAEMVKDLRAQNKDLMAENAALEDALDEQRKLRRAAEDRVFELERRPGGAP